MTLTTEQQILIEQRVANEAKSLGVAYLFWLFFGTIGGHRLYVGRIASGLCMLAAFLLGLLTFATGVGALILGALCIWTFMDFFFIPALARHHKNKVRRALTAKAEQANGVKVRPSVPLKLPSRIEPSF